jgi:hypothetical protein
LWSTLAVPVHASIRVWGCLLYASNAGKTFDLLPPLSGYEAPLRRSLGYSNYRVIAQREIAVESPTQNRLVSAGDIHVLLTSLSLEPDGKYLVGVAFTEGTKQVQESVARTKLAAKSILPFGFLLASKEIRAIHYSFCRSISERNPRDSQPTLRYSNTPFPQCSLTHGESSASEFCNS